jgi:hypothetical protein
MIAILTACGRDWLESPPPEVQDYGLSRLKQLFDPEALQVKGDYLKD